jgi:N-acetylornithine carbamoyltransferase
VKRDFLSVEEQPAGWFLAILDLASRIKRGEVAGGLEKKVLALVFLDPSLRTRASFETAMFLHGGHAVVLEPGRGSWALETRMGVVMDQDRVEHIVEAARVLGRYADALGLRSFAKASTWSEAREDAVLRTMARFCEKPVLNLESARRHPCQELADALTLREKLGEPRGKRFVLSWAWHPKALPTAVPASAALAAARLGMDVVIARPEGFDLDAEDMNAIRAVASAAGGAVSLVDDPEASLADADAVYAKAWGSVELYGRGEEEAALRNAQRGWRVTAERHRASRDGKAIVMHCLPVRRNVEIDDALLDSPHAVVTDQAENRLHVQRALLLDLLGGNTR